jgi:hypothetical protein
MRDMSNKSSETGKTGLVVRGLTAGAACAFMLAASLASAAPTAAQRDQAKRIYDRIAGVPPSPTELDTLANLMESSGPEAVALEATKAPSFYSVVLKNFVTPWTNRDQTVFAPLNDYTATVIGMVRDDKPFNTVLSSNILYTLKTGGLPAPSATGNEHYEDAETRGVDLKADLVETNQTAVYGTPDAGTAGLITTRAAAASFFIDGTNRAMFRFTMINHMCRDLEQLADTARPPDRIRQDVSRSPGGDSRIFLNNCIGCHSGMDPMAQAFAYYDFDDTQKKLVYTPGAVNEKYFINSDNFKPGFITPNEDWENRWRVGHNSLLGFSSGLPGKGTGAKSLGEEIANSDAFAVCQVEKAFKAVCFRAPSDAADRSAVSAAVSNFKAGYNLRTAFAETAAYCATH